MLWIVIVGTAATAIWPAWWVVKVFIRGLTFPALIRATLKTTLAFERVVEAEVTPEQWERIRTHWQQIQNLQ